MMKKAIPVLLLAVLLSLALALSASAMKDTKADRLDAARLDKISQFNLNGPFAPEVRASDQDIRTAPFDPNVQVPARTNARQPVGSALSPNAGQGPGESVDLTYDDWTWGRKRGRYVGTAWNGEFGASAQVDVHFVYSDAKDTTGDHTVAGGPAQDKILTGHNIYEATNGGDWPMLQNIGCDIQATDTAGMGNDMNMDISHSGLAVIAARSRFFINVDDDPETRLYQNMIFYQDLRFACYYDPTDPVIGNCSWIDSTLYRPLGQDQTAGGNYGWDPGVVVTWDGTNEITHVVLGEDAYGPAPETDDYASDLTYKIASYYRKVGSTASAGSWSTGIAIDTTWYHGWYMAAGQYPYHDKLAITYVNPTYYGALLNKGVDTDCWARRSYDGGLSWEPSFSITNYTNALAGDPAHFTCWIETQCFFDLNGDLHAIWNAKPTSADPYFDGFNWQDFDENIYHWSEATGNISKVANGNFMNDDMLTGSMNTLHCGFGGVNAGYLAFQSISQCDDKLYIVWNQIHERANRFPWRDAATQPAPGVLDDCSYDGERLSAANFDILMSVAKVATPDLWDAPRNITDTYTPGCGAPGDPEGAMLCASEYKPGVEKYNLDESSLSLTWPANTIKDMSPGQDYAGTSYLNMIYYDDQYPGSFWAQDLRGNNVPTLNSVKWIRLACVEPIEASQIRVIALGLQWPSWVLAGQVTNLPLVVVNEGNVVLNVTDVTTVATAGGSWLSASIAPTSGSPFQVPAGPANTATFDLIADATAISQPTWLDGTVTLTSDAANFPTLDVDIHILAADHVEPVVWDTVMTHPNMFSPFFTPEGECIALGVGNNGDLGWGAGSSGLINLDYVESELECGTRARDGYYLIGASAFTIIADDAAGTGAVLTQVFNDADQADETGWDPTNAKGSIANGEQLSSAGDYDSTYTGRFVNSDTTIAMERTVYAPRSTDPLNETINFVIVATKVYPADGQAHNNVTIGNVIDWDIPADSIPNNTAHLATNSSGDFLYLAGTDTVNSTSCQPNTGRMATEAFGGSYLASDFCGTQDPDDYFGFNALPQLIMVDTTHDRDGNPLVPNQPIPQVWWDETMVPGLNANATNDDQAVWFTFKQNYSLGATDTLWYWTVLTTTRNSTPGELSAQVTAARCWFQNTVYGCDVCTGCCLPPMRGDANDDKADRPTIGDISILIDAKFLSNTCDGLINCIDEADVNESASSYPAICDDISIGDISLLIDYLFITGPDAWDQGYGPAMLAPCP